MTCFTFGLWIVSGAGTIAMFALGGAWTRAIVAAYAIASLFSARQFSQRVYDYCAALEVGERNGWGLIVKGDVDCARTAHIFCSHPHGLFCAGVSLNLMLSRKVAPCLAANAAVRALAAGVGVSGGEGLAENAGVPAVHGACDARWTPGSTPRSSRGESRRWCGAAGLTERAVPQKRVWLLQARAADRGAARARVHVRGIAQRRSSWLPFFG